MDEQILLEKNKHLRSKIAEQKEIFWKQTAELESMRTEVRTLRDIMVNLNRILELKIEGHRKNGN